ncbi:MAG: beta-lactamase family protein, partial [bacterium]|nr:beta-lactamase family protein [bacterium]
MKEKSVLKLRMKIFVLSVVMFVIPFFSFSQGEGEKPAPVSTAETGGDFPSAQIEEKVRELMDEWDIPGLSLVIVKGERVYTMGFGYADVDKETPVTPDTLFELASTSKAFTALAVLQLEKDGLVNPDSPVSKYLPWFYVNYQGKKHPVTLKQLLYHTSGIPTRTVTMIPPGNAEDALEKTIRGMVGFELERKPGTEFEYATINYDVLGAVIEAVTGMTYEAYMAKHIFAPLELGSTFVGRSPDNPAMAKGHKISFFAAREYDAPVYRGNNPAGYVVSNGRDLVRWLQLQLGLVENPYTPLIRESHKPNRGVSANPDSLGAYGMGWFSYVTGDDIVDHVGANPNFTAYIGFSPGEKTGVAVLANSNSSATPSIGRYVLGLARGRETPEPDIPDAAVDKGASVISIMVGFF